MKTTMTMEEIRALYPHPRSPLQQDGTEGRPGYCVGGALCQMLWGKGYGRAFPSVSWLRLALQEANPCLFFQDAERFAASIAETNDDGQFDDAWALLKQALEWQAEERAMSYTREQDSEEYLRNRAIALLDIIAMEFRTDPQSVQCFDLRVVKEIIDVSRRLNALRTAGEKAEGHGTIS